MPKKSIQNFITEAEDILRKQEYSDKNSKAIMYTWRKFQNFCEMKGYKHYASSYRDEFITELSRSVPPLKPATIHRKTSEMKMLELFAQNGTWEKGELNPLPELSTEFSGYLIEQDNLLSKNGYSESSRKTMYKQVHLILRFFQNADVTKFSEMNESLISSYLLTLKGHAKSTMRGELSRLRVFLSYLYLLEYTTVDFSIHVPQYAQGQSQSMVKIWKSDEINKVLETVDRSSPKGKRDAAIIAIAAELAVRSSDIRNLKLSDIDWELCSISFTQSKTRKPNVLPLSEKVGAMIIDYLRVRPQTDSEYLFVSMNPPYDKMKTFASSFQRYVHRSGVSIPCNAHHGLHSLRATVATKLLSADVSPDIISSFLGHSDRETLNRYIRLDINNLRECALSFEDGELI